MDLMQRAGVDVSDWKNYKRGDTHPGANPKYCYEWALMEPSKLVVCNFWYERMKEVAGQIEQHLVLADAPGSTETDPTRRARRAKMARLITQAATENLPVRVIVLDGDPRTISKTGQAKVTHRALDPETWAVVHSEPEKAYFVLRRGAAPAPFADQHDLSRPPDSAISMSTATVIVRSRSGDVRLFALRRANGRCEYCGEPGFLLADGRIYLETHHVISLASGGLDGVSNVVALCANHHREAHHGRDSARIRGHLQKLREQ